MTYEIMAAYVNHMSSTSIKKVCSQKDVHLIFEAHVLKILGQDTRQQENCRGGCPAMEGPIIAEFSSLNALNQKAVSTKVGKSMGQQNDHVVESCQPL